CRARQARGPGVRRRAGQTREARGDALEVPALRDDETERQHTAEAQVLENLLPAGAGPERVRAGLDLVVHAEDARVEPEEERSADQVLGGERVGDLRERGADRDAD